MFELVCDGNYDDTDAFQAFVNGEEIRMAGNTLRGGSEGCGMDRPLAEALIYSCWHEDRPFKLRLTRKITYKTGA